ncbi:hypothetical protein N9I00_01040 [bacterium]|nr:hypothetical protein [bacterium]
MKYKQINEGVKYNELKSLVKSKVSIADFEPKVGTTDDVTVVTFYVNDEKPANDLARFIERGVNEILDTEVSPTADENGMYLVFVEIKNEDLMRKVFEILEDINGLIDIEEWIIDFYNGPSLSIEADKVKTWLKDTK